MKNILHSKHAIHLFLHVCRKHMNYILLLFPRIVNQRGHIPLTRKSKLKVRVLMQVWILSVRNYYFEVYLGILHKVHVDVAVRNDVSCVVPSAPHSQVTEKHTHFFEGGVGFWCGHPADLVRAHPLLQDQTLVSLGAASEREGRIPSAITTLDSRSLYPTIDCWLFESGSNERSVEVGNHFSKHGYEIVTHLQSQPVAIVSPHTLKYLC